mmetsp:Transcript_28299/g.51580  ORF Transcript_28299/g.51580 Transcript_28299/m.51580 type:complete len:140 (+) Transcript_28299:93-512(+)
MPHYCQGHCHGCEGCHGHQHGYCGGYHKGFGYYGGHSGHCHHGGSRSWHDGPRSRPCHGYYHGDYEERANIPEPEPECHCEEKREKPSAPVKNDDMITSAILDLGSLVSALTEKVTTLEKKSADQDIDTQKMPALETKL